MNAAINPAYTTKILLGNLRDTHSSSVACRTEVVVRHAFIGNDDDCHVHHIQVEVRMNILEAE